MIHTPEQCKQNRDDHLERALQHLERAMTWEVQRHQEACRDDKDFGEGYAQGCHEVCRTAVKFWKGTL